MSELIEMPYGNDKSLAGEFIKAYTEVQFDVEMKRKQCFVNYHCSSDCPNAEYEMADDRYGFGIADDEDCLFVNSKDCPEYKEVEDNDSIL